MKIIFNTKIIFLGIIFFGVFGMAGSSLAADFYVTQNASGSDTGTDCSNAHSTSWFNAAGNWAVPKQTGKVGPGDTVHLCGTFNLPANDSTNGILKIPGSGSDGLPITILFEDGAKLQSPQFSPSGAIMCHWFWGCHGNVIIDGGTNGVIENTDNGTTATYGGTKKYGASSTGIALAGWNGNTASNIQVKNLTIRNIYQNNGSNQWNLDPNGQETTGIRLWDMLKNIEVSNNDISGNATSINFGFDGVTSDSINIHDNVIHNMNWGISLTSANTTGIASNVNVYNNEIYDWTNWQCPGTARWCAGGQTNIQTWNSGTTYSQNQHCSYGSDYYRSLQNNNANHAVFDTNWWVRIPDTYHQDGIIIWNGDQTDATHSSAPFRPYIYNNYIHGNMGNGSVTSYIFITTGNPTQAGGDSAYGAVEPVIFNNLLAGDSTMGGNNPIQLGWESKNAQVYNNTLIGGSGTGWTGQTWSDSENACIVTWGKGGNKYYNNLCVNFCNMFLATEAYEGEGTGDPNTRISQSDNNLFYNLINQVVKGTNATYTLAQWRALSGSGRDNHTVFSDPKFDSSLHLQTGSGAISAGANLASVGITALNKDKAGSSRPASAAWDIGAYQYGSTSGDTTPPAAPKGLIVN